MRPIPLKLRNDIAEDLFYQQCCVTGTRIGKIDFHHNLIFAGRQVNEKWAILPIHRDIHKEVSQPQIKKKLDWIMLNRATDAQLRKYSKAVNLIAERDRLNEIYGKF